MALSNNSVEIQKLYVAYFSRPADVLGLQYWENVVATTGSTAAVAKAFAASSEYRAATAQQDGLHLVTSTYQNLFGHAPDAAGLAYWAGGLANATVTIADLVTAVAAGAQGSDQTAFRNKVTVAMAFTAELDTAAEINAYAGLRANAAAKIYLTGISDDASVAAALVPATLRASVDAVLHLNDGPLPPPVAVDHADGAETIVALVGTPSLHTAGLAMW